MAAANYGVWAIDIGNSSVKALRLSFGNEGPEVTGFDDVPYAKILTSGGVTREEREELVTLALRTFLSRNVIGKDEVVVSVPGQNSFARFVKLPPVESRKIAEIVNYEAAQQIPFDINEVQWDWQLMDAEAAEKKVGIFAIKSEIVSTVLEYFERENIRVSMVQMAPMALYNYLVYDRPDLTSSESNAAAVLNIGADAIDLVVCTSSSVWQRSISIAGNAFTKAIADAFKLNFEKAEKLKRTAPMSKYARQILQAMKPVFTDLSSEIQRSLGFYNSSNPGVKITKIVALGGGTKMRGLLKYLQQTLQIPIEQPDSFKKVSIGPEISAAKFHDSVCDSGVVYGLAVQGLGLARIESNLLPRSIARSMAWTKKNRFFILSAFMILLAAALVFGRAFFDRAAYNSADRTRSRISGILRDAGQAEDKLKQQKDKLEGYKTLIE